MSLSLLHTPPPTGPRPAKHSHTTHPATLSPESAGADCNRPIRAFTHHPIAAPLRASLHAIRSYLGASDAHTRQGVLSTWKSREGPSPTRSIPTRRSTPSPRRHQKSGTARFLSHAREDRQYSARSAPTRTKCTCPMPPASHGIPDMATDVMCMCHLGTRTSSDPSGGGA